MYSRLLVPPQDKSFFLFGPRGTGKTTWVKQNLPQAFVLDLLESELYNDLLAQPSRLENLIPKDFQDWIVLDEVQKIPALLNEVHRLIEKFKYRFVLTGSSARSLKKKGVNLLAGRALTLGMHPLTAYELGKDYRFKHSLQFGQLPSVYQEEDPKAYLESYVKTYLREEVQQEGLTRNLGDFSRFLEAASFSQASVLNISNLAREAAVDRKRVEGYIAILEDLLLALRLPVFTKKSKRRLTAHPKLFFFDVGIYQTLRPAGPLDLMAEREGVALEGLLLQEIRAHNDYGRWGYDLFYWRTSNNVEVDFVLYGPQGLKAIEVKRKSKVSKKDFSGLRAFQQDYPMAETYLLYGGTRRMREGETEVIPLIDFLKNPAGFLS